MPETRKTAKSKEDPKEEPGGAAAAPAGMVPGESTEMFAIRLLHSAFADADARRAAEAQAAADRQQQHEKMMAALYAQIADKLAAPAGVGTAGGPPAAAGPPGGPPPSGVPGVGVKAFDISHVDALPSGAQFQEFHLWKEAWGANGKRHKLHMFPREEQVFAFMQAAGAHAVHVLKFHFKVDPEDAAVTVPVLMSHLEGYFRANQSTTVAGVKFTERFQRVSEPFDEFRFALDELAADAELCGHCGDRRMVEQIIAGLSDQELKTELLRVRKPTLEYVVETCRAYEAAARDSSVGGRSRAREGTVSAVQGRMAYKERQRDEIAARAKGKCLTCGGREHSTLR